MNAPTRFQVYHATDLSMMAMPQPERWHVDRMLYYRHVATVDAPLERVFTLTNHIDRSWVENREVIWHVAGEPLRSTSVGDVIVSVESGQAWLILPIGLQAL